MNRTIKILKDTALSLFIGKDYNSLSGDLFKELKEYSSNINKCFYSVKVLSSKNAINHYDRLTRCIVFDIYKDSINKKGKYTSFYHELGHHVDWELGLISNNELFRKTILMDCEYILNEFSIKSLILFIQKDSRTNGFSDILSGATKNSFSFKYRHETSYWEGSIMRLSYETFAHFYEALIRNDKFKINLYKKILPKAFDMFLYFIGEKDFTKAI